MRILITSGLRSKDIGGPSQYGPNLKREFERLGHDSRLKIYSKAERVLPLGLRHLYFLLKILPSILWANYVIALDTYSVGVPTILAAKMFRKKSIARVGGDFLWESYVNRTGHLVTLPEFYKVVPKLSLKEKLISLFTKAFLREVDVLAFNTEWQKDIWSNYYKVSDDKLYVVRNYIPAKGVSKDPTNKVFLWSGRNNKLKNLDMLKEVSSEIKLNHKEFSLEIISSLSHKDLLRRVSESYAVIQPSISDICPNFIIEAVSFNKPFIMTEETGMKEIYNKGGIFINPLDKDELRGSIEKMLNHNEYKRFVEDLELFNLKHSWPDIAKEFISICNKV